MEPADLRPIEAITELDVYQEETVATAFYPRHVEALYNLIGGLGETGEYGRIVLKAVDRVIESETKRGCQPQDLLVVRHALARALDACQVLEKLKRPVREGKMTLPPVELTDEEREQGASELGDRFWYLAGDARALRRRLSEIAQQNIAKLRARRAAGVVHSTGETVAERLRNKS